MAMHIESLSECLRPLGIRIVREENSGHLFMQYSGSRAPAWLANKETLPAHKWRCRYCARHNDGESCAGCGAAWPL